MSFAAAVLLLGMTMADDEVSQKTAPPETGRVSWLRDVDAAHRTSRETGRPVAILFQEIPGCQTCQNFGVQVLSHPLMVEALEDEFVPVLVHNNRKGNDAKILAKYSEPAWNNPVMRFFGGGGDELTPRKDGIWSVGGTAARMIAALEAAERDVPAYLRFVAEELDGRREVATFAMHCYWEGEARLGAVDGVVRTESGWRDGQEVVRVAFDPERVAFRTLLEEAREMKCASTVFAHNADQLTTARELVGRHAQAATKEKPYSVAKLSDQKYYLRHSRANYLPLTPLQATKLNHRVALQRPFDDLLSPRQAELMQRLTAAEPAILKGLSRPENVVELDEYALQLRQKLH